MLALASVPKREPVEVFVFSDGTQDALVSDKALAGRVRYVQTGETDANLAITRLAVRSNPLQRLRRGTLRRTDQSLVAAARVPAGIEDGGGRPGRPDGQSRTS